MIQIRLLKEYNLKGYTLIEGFPGAGIVGPMSASYIVEKLGMEYMGNIDSDSFPPIAAVHNGMPMFTARLYLDTKNKLVVALSEFTIPTSVVRVLGMELLSFVRKYNISKIISIGGMPSQQQTSSAYVVSSDKGLISKAVKLGLKNINEGVIAGVSAILLTGAAEYDIPVIDILVEVNPMVMDPKYAQVAIEALNKLMGISIDLEELKKEAKQVEAKVRDILKKTKESHEHYTSAAGPEPEGPPTYT